MKKSPSQSVTSTLFLKNVDLDFPNETDRPFKEYQLPVFLNKNTESRQFGTSEQLFEKYMFKIDFES